MSNSNDQQSSQKKSDYLQSDKGCLYDTERLNEIPILSVCLMLNIPIEKKHSHRAMCKVRNERTASTVLYLDSNTFYDFGGGTGGDVIAFYAYAAEVSQGEAMKALGQAFGVVPTNPRAGLRSNELTLYDWKHIGIYGERAAKNFIFNVDRMSLERLAEISEQYNMSMNELRKAHPRTYERVLKQKALPYVRTLRNTYYLNVYSLYCFYKNTGHPDLFQAPANQQDLTQEKESLIQAERALSRAVQGTSITFRAGTSYEPNTVLKQLLRGEPELGSRSYKGMQALARKNDCFIRYRTMDVIDYQCADFSEIPHTAFVKGERVSVGFLPADEEKILAIMDEVKETHTPTRSSSSSDPSLRNIAHEPDIDRCR